MNFYECKKSIVIAIIYGFSLSILPANAIDVEADGSFRVRYENKQDFNLSENGQDYNLTQLRINAKIGINDKISSFIELQDARIFGEELDEAPPINSRANNQPFEDQLDFHQLYTDVKITKSGTLRLGRQKLNLGDKRLVASLEWVNTARVHDGIRYILGQKSGRQADIFASRLVGVDPDDFNDHSIRNRYLDAEFHGVHVIDKSTIDGDQLEYFWYLRDNSDFEDHVHTLGGRWLTRLHQWQLEVQAAAQSGDFVGQDHSAYMYRLSGKRQWGKNNVTIAYNYASGDDDLTDNKHKTFDNLYPLNHAYYGYMDFFSLQNLRNFEAIYQRKMNSKNIFRIAYQHFWLAEENDSWYNAGLKPVRTSSQDVDGEIGSEIDVTLKVPLPTYKTTIVVGYSHFFSGQYTEDTGASEDADFMFLSVKLNFK